MPKRNLLVEAVIPHKVGVAAKSVRTCNLFFLVNMPPYTAASTNLYRDLIWNGTHGHFILNESLLNSSKLSSLTRERYNDGCCSVIKHVIQ